MTTVNEAIYLAGVIVKEHLGDVVEVFMLFC
jgi:hypothetical protein